MALMVGDRLPAFPLPCTDGETISLDSLSGRKAMLYFYPKDDTSGCTKEAQEFQALKAEFAADTAVVGISSDSLASHDKLRSKYGLEFPLASGEARTMLEAFGVWVEKSMYGRTYVGTERTTVRDGTVAKVWPKVKVPGHAREVLETARAL
jgi:thioredoxin-dependent peroxiredoxin